MHLSIGKRPHNRSAKFNQEHPSAKAKSSSVNSKYRSTDSEVTLTKTFCTSKNVSSKTSGYVWPGIESTFSFFFSFKRDTTQKDNLQYSSFKKYYIVIANNASPARNVRRIYKLSGHCAARKLFFLSAEIKSQLFVCPNWSINAKT